MLSIWFNNWIKINKRVIIKNTSEFLLQLSRDNVARFSTSEDNPPLRPLPLPLPRDPLWPLPRDPRPRPRPRPLPHLIVRINEESFQIKFKLKSEWKQNIYIRNLGRSEIWKRQKSILVLGNSSVAPMLSAYLDSEVPIMVSPFLLLYLYLRK